MATGKQVLTPRLLEARKNRPTAFALVAGASFASHISSDWCLAGSPAKYEVYIIHVQVAGLVRMYVCGLNWLSLSVWRSTAARKIMSSIAWRRESPKKEAVGDLPWGTQTDVANQANAGTVSRATLEEINNPPVITRKLFSNFHAV